VEASASTPAVRLPVRERIRRTPAARIAACHPGRTALALLGVLVVVVVVSQGVSDTFRVGLNGLSLGSIYALGAVGLTLVYGILKLTNFAHGDFLTFGAYMTYLASVTWGIPILPAILFAIVMTAVLGVAFEKTMWGPMRVRGAGLLQLLLMSIGLAFLVRYSIQFAWGTEIRQLPVDRETTVEIFGVTTGRTRLIVIGVGLAVLVGIGLLLKFTLIGKRMRALSDNLELAETAGIDTSRIVLFTWVVSGGLAGLAGALAAALIQVYPELGFELLLALFAAVVLGGIGDAFGALVGGLLLGVMIEWSTLFWDPQWKIAVGFVVLIIVLIVRPQGIFGRAKTV
jgi:neutral amino acid transport system permease protein